MTAPKHIVVTPYRDEPIEWLRQCNRSVVGQTVPTTHVMAADGLWRMDIATFESVDIGGPVQVGDSGGTPRANGGRWANGHGADVLSYLDADDWWEPDHAERAQWAIRRHGADLVISGMRFVDPEGADLGITYPYAALGDRPGRAVEENRKIFGVTSTITITRRLFRFVEAWRAVPAPMAPANDCLFTWVLFSARPTVVWTCRPTAVYRQKRPRFYEQHGLPVPATATKDFVAAQQDVWRHWRGLDEEARNRLWRRLGAYDVRIPTAGGMHGYFEEALRVGGMVKWGSDNIVSVVR